MPQNIQDYIAIATRSYPRFKDGRIDYTSERVCFAINCVVIYDDQILMTLRSNEVIAYPETWSGVSGFIDEIVPLETVVRKELQEEVQIVEEDIKRITLCDEVVQTDSLLEREWHIFPVLVELIHAPRLATNWENKEARWVPISEVSRLKLLPGFMAIFNAARQKLR